MHSLLVRRRRRAVICSSTPSHVAGTVRIRGHAYVAVSRSRISFGTRRAIGWWTMTSCQSPPASSGALHGSSALTTATCAPFLTEHGVVADRILMLAMPRTLGYVFNPDQRVLVLRRAGRRVAVLAEVHNTYRRTSYLPASTRRDRTLRSGQGALCFTVLSRRWPLRDPGERTRRSVSVTVTLHRDNDAPFVASLRGTRRSASRVNVGARIPRSPRLAHRPFDPLAGGAALVTRSEGAAAMSVVSHEAERHARVDLRRWAGLAPPKSAPIRAALARSFFDEWRAQTGIRVELPDGTSISVPPMDQS